MLFALIIIIGLAVKGDTLMNMREYELFEIIGKLIESNSTKASEYLLAILPPLIVGILLAILGFVLDRNKQKNIDAVSEKTQLLSDKIDSQKTLIQALNSIETKNRENSMQIAKDLYKLLSLFFCFLFFHKLFFYIVNELLNFRQFVPRRFAEVENWKVGKFVSHYCLKLSLYL